MSQLERSGTLEVFARHRVSAIIRTDDRGVAEGAMRAAVAGGFRIVEFTLTIPGALDLVRAFAAQQDLIVGAGTVLEVEQARAAVDAGARFIVSPVVDPAVIAAARGMDVVSIPGAFTPTEMLAAHRAGADLVKLFPAPADVAQTVRAVLGPLPFLKIFPTAGVTAENLASVLEAGAVGAGFVRALFAPEDLTARDFGAIERRARGIVKAAEAIAAR